MLTRDSQLLKALQVLALVMGILANTITTPAEFGLSDIAMHWISLLAVIVGTVSGVLGTSPLPGHHDDRIVRRDIDTTPKD